MDAPSCLAPSSYSQGVGATPLLGQTIGDNLRVPSRKYGEEVMAWVRLAPDAAASEEELTCHCQDRLASYKRPRYWRIVDAFPMTVTGKVQKYRLREMAVELLGLQSAAEEKTA
jgi:fatty-acyl-CoA synthase